MVFDNEMLTAKTFFHQHFIQLNDLWLETCVQWFREQHQNYDQKTLHTEIYEQWLLLDLKDVEIPILPLNLNSQIKMILPNNYSLQLMSVIDISKAKYAQLNQIRNKNIALKSDLDLENVGSGKRMLQLTLTDGLQEVKAIEYKIIPSLNVNLTPGMKIRIIGPVTVRRGRIMLEESNIKLLGGEVEELLVSNAAENVLARALKLPENPQPAQLEDISLINNTIVNHTQNSLVHNSMVYSNNLHNQNLNNINSNFTRNNFNSNQNKNIPNQNIKNYSYNQNNSKQTCFTRNQTNFNEEDETKIEEEINLLLEAEESFTKAKSKSPDLFEDLDFDIDELEKIDVEMHEAESTLKIESLLSNPIQDKNNLSSMKTASNSTVKLNRTNEPTISRISPELFEDTFDLENFDCTKIVKENISSTPKKEQNLTEKSVLSVRELVKLQDEVSKGKYKIRIKFKSVSRKLNVSNEEYTIKILVGDNTGDLEVSLHTNLVSEMMGMCPSAIFALKDDCESKDSTVQTRIIKAIDGFKKQLEVLNSVVDVLLEKGKSPCVVKICN